MYLIKKHLIHKIPTNKNERKQDLSASQAEGRGFDPRFPLAENKGLTN